MLKIYLIIQQLIKPKIRFGRRLRFERRPRPVLETFHMRCMQINTISYLSIYYTGTYNHGTSQLAEHLTRMHDCIHKVSYPGSLKGRPSWGHKYTFRTKLKEYVLNPTTWHANKTNQPLWRAKWYAANYTKKAAHSSR